MFIRVKKGGESFFICIMCIIFIILDGRPDMSAKREDVKNTILETYKIIKYDMTEGRNEAKYFSGEVSDMETGYPDIIYGFQICNYINKGDFKKDLDYIFECLYFQENNKYDILARIFALSWQYYYTFCVILLCFRVDMTEKASQPDEERGLNPLPLDNKNNLLLVQSKPNSLPRFLKWYIK